MLNPNDTTPHRSRFISISEVFCCKFCGAEVAFVVLPGDELAYECSAPRCGHTVHVDCPEGLAVRDELAITLPTPRAGAPRRPRRTAHPGCPRARYRLRHRPCVAG